MEILQFRKLYMCDFGLSKRYADAKKGFHHIKNENPKKFTMGTSKYQSKKVLLRNTPSRRDDVIVGVN